MSLHYISILCIASHMLLSAACIVFLVSCCSRMAAREPCLGCRPRAVASVDTVNNSNEQSVRKRAVVYIDCLWGFGTCRYCALQYAYPVFNEADRWVRSIPESVWHVILQFLERGPRRQYRRAF